MGNRRKPATPGRTVRDDLHVTDDWWSVRRDVLLAAVAAELGLWAEDDLDDPGAGELARLAADIGAEATADGRPPALAAAGRLLTEAAAELHRADRFLGTFLPQVVRHLRAAHGLVRGAWDHLHGVRPPGPDVPARCPVPD